jgi:hypothetical protein
LLVYEIDRGKKHKVDRISFRGNNQIPEKYPIHAQGFASRVYEYYDPNVNATAKPVHFEVSGR